MGTEGEKQTHVVIKQMAIASTTRTFRVVLDSLRPRGL